MDLRFSGMSVTEAAALLRVSEEHLRRLLRGGEVIGVPYGGRIGWRLHREYVEALHDQMTADREGKDAARRGVIPGTPPPGRPRKATRRRPR